MAPGDSGRRNAESDKLRVVPEVRHNKMEILMPFFEIVKTRIDSETLTVEADTKEAALLKVLTAPYGCQGSFVIRNDAEYQTRIAEVSHNEYVKRHQDRERQNGPVEAMPTHNGLQAGQVKIIEDAQGLVGSISSK